MTKSFEMDMTKGPIVKNMIIYALPILGINIVQLLFNAADVTILGIFTSDSAVAAVGSTTALVNLIIGFFIGLSLSANVLVARYMGARDVEKSRRLVGCAVCLSLVVGVFLALIGFLCSRTFLIWMKCDQAVLNMATKYMQIYFLGMPIIMLYNFCASIMRAVGDTVRPLIFLIVGGVLNIGLNIFFILVLGKDVEGVAIATVASQAVAAVLSIAVLVKSNGYAKLEKKYLRIYKGELSEIIKYGLPIGVQRCLFSLSNVVVASTINTYGEQVVAANTIGHQFDAIVHDSADAFAMATMAFVSQNIGAQNFKRVWQVLFRSLIIVSSVALIAGALCVLFRKQLCDIMTNDVEIIEYASMRIMTLSFFHFLTGTMNVFANLLRGMGKNLSAMISCLACTCGFRILWIKTIYLLNPTLKMIYAVYPISWALCLICYLIIAIPSLKKLQSNSENIKREIGQNEIA